MTKETATPATQPTTQKERAMKLFIEMDTCFRRCKAYRKKTPKEKQQAFEDAGYIFLFLHNPSVK